MEPLDGSSSEDDFKAQGTSQPLRTTGPAVEVLASEEQDVEKKSRVSCRGQKLIDNLEGS